MSSVQLMNGYISSNWSYQRTKYCLLKSLAAYDYPEYIFLSMQASLQQIILVKVYVFCIVCHITGLYSPFLDFLAHA